MSWDLDRVLAAVADAERDDRDDEPTPGPLPGSIYERVQQAAQSAEERHNIAADGPALPTAQEVQAYERERARERHEAEDRLTVRPDPNLAGWFEDLERDRQRRTHLHRDDVAELQPYRTT